MSHFSLFAADRLTRLLCIALAAGLGLSSVASAQVAKKKSHEEGSVPVVGDIVSISKDTVEIKDHAGKMHKFKIDEHTMLGTLHERMKLVDFKKGEHVYVTYHGDHALVIHRVHEHTGQTPVAGEIVAVAKDSLEIKDHAAKLHKYKLDAHTKYGTAKEHLKFEDLKKGEHVLVSFSGDHATTVREVPAHGHGHSSELQKKRGK